MRYIGNLAQVLCLATVLLVQVDAMAAGGYADEDRDWGVAPTAALRTSRYHAPTPRTLPGARVVTTDELKALLEKGPRPYLIDVLGGAPHRTLAGAFWMAGAGAGDMKQDEERRFLDTLAKFAGGDKSRPLVFFCSSAQCWLSHNAAVRALAAGYTGIIWYRGGIDAWHAAGLPMALSDPFAW